MTMESRKEKVLEIAKRAGFVVDISGHGDRNADLHYTLDRFVELIIKECDSICQQHAKEHADKNVGEWHNPTEQLVAKRMGHKIKQHFGIE